MRTTLATPALAQANWDDVVGDGGMAVTIA
jgi:hypothetical protein